MKDSSIGDTARTVFNHRVSQSFAQCNAELFIANGMT